MQAVWYRPLADQNVLVSGGRQALEPEMEALTRLVTESLARHGFDRPLDYRRLHWSRWFRCESHHSLLFVPSKPGVFALAEEITHVAAPAPVSQPGPEAGSRQAEAASRRMLAVAQFLEADDMAFVLDRMLSYQNPMRARLVSGRYFVRFVVIEEHSQRRSICSALNQWMISTAEVAAGIGSHFASSLELTPATEYLPPTGGVQPSLFDVRVAGNCPEQQPQASSPPETSPPLAPLSVAASHLESEAATNIHCPSQFPAGF